MTPDGGSTTPRNPLPDGLRITLDAEHAQRAKASLTAWKRDERRYIVYLDGEVVGTVESVRAESWRKSGRIRTGLIGRPKSWWARAKGGRAITRTAYSRQAAVDALLREVRRG